MLCINVFPQNMYSKKNKVVFLPLCHYLSHTMILFAHVQVITVYTKDRKIELIPDSDSASDSSAAQAARSSSHRDQDDSQSGQKQDSRSVRVKVDGQDVDLAQHQSSSLR